MLFGARARARASRIPSPRLPSAPIPAPKPRALASASLCCCRPPPQARFWLASLDLATRGKGPSTARESRVASLVAGNGTKGKAPSQLELWERCVCMVRATVTFLAAPRPGSPCSSDPTERHFAAPRPGIPCSSDLTARPRRPWRPWPWSQPPTKLTNAAALDHVCAGTASSTSSTTAARGWRTRSCAASMRATPRAAPPSSRGCATATVRNHLLARRGGHSCWPARMPPRGDVPREQTPHTPATMPSVWPTHPHPHAGTTRARASSTAPSRTARSARTPRRQGRGQNRRCLGHQRQRRTWPPSAARRAASSEGVGPPSRPPSLRRALTLTVRPRRRQSRGRRWSCC